MRRDFLLFRLFEYMVLAMLFSLFYGLFIQGVKLVWLRPGPLHLAVGAGMAFEVQRFCMLLLRLFVCVIKGVFVVLFVLFSVLLGFLYPRVTWSLMVASSNFVLVPMRCLDPIFCLGIL